MSTVVYDVLVSESRYIKRIKTELERIGELDKTRKIIGTGNGTVLIIPTKYRDEQKLQKFMTNTGIQDFQVQKSVIKENAEGRTSQDPIRRFVERYLVKNKEEEEAIQQLLRLIPKRWSIYPPMLLINNQQTFDSVEWLDWFERHDRVDFFRSFLQECFPQCTHIAINKPIIEQDVMRRPFNIKPVFGDFGPDPIEKTFDDPQRLDFDRAFWCSVVQNGIFQTWAPRYTMFSRGNVKEKARILNSFQNVSNTSVVDMYAGIGYFTLSYLKLGAKHLFCFEINPWSVEGLIRAVVQNGHSFRLIRHSDEAFEFQQDVQVYIFLESNEHAMKRLSNLDIIVSHINMGLLPSSKQSWYTSLQIVKKFGNEAQLHIHENIAADKLGTAMGDIEAELGSLNTELQVEPVHLEKIKTFAPDVWHVCCDFAVHKGGV